MLKASAKATPRAGGSDAKCVKISVAGPAGIGGDIVAQLAPHDAPNTVANFLSYVDKKYYRVIKGTIFHRVIKGFMVQGGGFTQVDNFGSIAVLAMMLRRKLGKQGQKDVNG